jgi:DHA1 family quinolone resistance protein-like MFS transporter
MKTFAVDTMIPRGLTKNLVFVYTLNQSMHWFVIGLVFPVMILIILGKDVDIFQAGVAVAIYSATTIILEIPTGGAADIVGRKRVYMISLLFLFFSGLAFLISWDFITIVLVVVLNGTARALSSGTIDAWFVDEFKRQHPSGNLQEALAKAGIFIPAGIGLGSLVGGVLPPLSEQLGISNWGFGPYALNLLAFMIMTVVQALLTYILVVENFERDTAAGRSISMRGLSGQLSTAVKFGVKNRVVLVLLVAIAILGFGISSVELLWQPRVQEISGDTLETWILGVLAAGYFFSSSVGNLLSTPTCRLLKNNYPAALAVLRAAVGLALLFLAWQESMLWFALFYFLMFFFNGVSDSPHATMFNNQVPKKVRSTLLSFQSVMLQIGGLFGSLIIGFIAKAYSIPFAWTIAAVVVLLSSGTYLVLMTTKFAAALRQTPDTCSSSKDQ